MSFPTLGYVQRLYDFLRRHPTGVDSFWAVMLFGVAALELAEAYPSGRDRALSLPAVIALCVVVALRRRTRGRCCG